MLRFRLLLLPAWLLCTILPAIPTLAAERVAVTLGTATPGGGFPVYGDALLRSIAETDPDLLVEARNTRGSTENIPLLEAGKLDIALVQGEAAHEALAGIGRPRANLRIISAMYSTPGMFVVPADSNVRSIEDLRGKAVAFGARSSGLVILARYVLDGLGLDMDRDFKAVYLDKAGDGPDLLKEGRVAALWGGGSSWPGFVKVTSSPGGGRFIVPTASEIARIRSRHAFLKPLTLAAGSFPGQPQALDSVGSWSFIMARPDLDEAVAYRLAKAIHLGEAALARRLPQASETTAANTVAALPAVELLHPGVRRYLKDTGAMN